MRVEAMRGCAGVEEHICGDFGWAAPFQWLAAAKLKRTAMGRNSTGRNRGIKGVRAIWAGSAVPVPGAGGAEADHCRE